MSMMITTKTTGLAKSGSVTRTIATRINRAFEARNEKVARADAELLDAVKRAAADITAAEGPTVSAAPADKEPAA